jgi:L-ascorbate metabolism protein UlaG (beta-lactamase superfamily)
MGDPAGFVVQAEGRSVYHTGDTAIFSDMALIQRIYKPQVGLVCVGDRFTMGPETAAMACNEFLDLELVVPIHWGTFPLLTGDPEDFRRRVTRGRVHVAAPGEPFDA